MAVTLGHDRDIEDPHEHFLRINTRIAGGGRIISATAEPPTIVVDIRELRSPLVSLIHASNVVVVPCTLTVGDYVLSPEIVVERKSLRDLQQSFRSGRLFQQVAQMTKYYQYQMLLIEFDQNKSFTLEPFAERSGSINENDLQSKLVLLTVHYPKLRIVWSSSPYQTAEIFLELKKGNPEPDPSQAVRIGLNQADDVESASMPSRSRPFNETPQEMLRCVPGVNKTNISALMIKYSNISEVANAPESELNELIGREAGVPIYRFFNTNQWDVDDKI
jgi:DNA excision repair protein ERCC-4